MPTLGDIAKLLSLPSLPAPQASLVVTGVATLVEATANDLAVISSDAYAKRAPTSKAAAFIVQRKVKLPQDFNRPALRVDDADLATARVLELFAPPVPRPPVGVDPAARIAGSAQLGPDVAIGFNVFVGERVRLGARTILHPGVYIGDDTTVGDDCVLFPNVTVRERIRIGSRVT